VMVVSLFTSSSHGITQCGLGIRLSTVDTSVWVNYNSVSDRVVGVSHLHQRHWKKKKSCGPFNMLTSLVSATKLLQVKAPFKVMLTKPQDKRWAGPSGGDGLRSGTLAKSGPSNRPHERRVSLSYK
jgi:hypothetical protein